MYEARPQQTHRQVEELRDGQWRNYLTDYPFTWGNYVTADMANGRTQSSVTLLLTSGRRRGVTATPVVTS